MSRSRRRGLAVLGVASLLLAAALGLLARSVLVADRELRELATAVARGEARELGRPLQVRVGEALLRTGEERAYLSAVAAFDAARAAPSGAGESRADAKARLTRVAGRDSSPARRAEAGNLYAVLLYEEALADESGRERLLELALAVLQEAVTDDPANDEAKANLELVARASAAEGGRLGESPGESGETGAGSSPPGTGF